MAQKDTITKMVYMNLKFLLFLLLCFSTPITYAGAMSQIHLETHEAIYDYFNEYVERIEVIRFAENEKDCFFVTQATVKPNTYQSYHCRVCFVGERSRFWAESVACDQTN